jgi:hypothetical protein
MVDEIRTLDTLQKHEGMTNKTEPCHSRMSRFWIPPMSGIQKAEILSGIQN